MKTSILTELFMASTLALAFAGCATDEIAAPEPEALTSTDESALTCTPGAETCDYGCNFDGAQFDGPTPTTDDCIIRCNAAGTAWQLVVDCGYAQNFPFSASCLNSQPHPVCQTGTSARRGRRDQINRPGDPWPVPIRRRSGVRDRRGAGLAS